MTAGVLVISLAQGQLPLSRMFFMGKKGDALHLLLTVHGPQSHCADLTRKNPKWALRQIEALGRPPAAPRWDC